MGKTIWEFNEKPYFVAEREDGLIYIVESVRIGSETQDGTVYRYRKTSDHGLTIGTDIIERELDGLTLAVASLPEINIQAQRINECIKLARITGDEYVAIKEWERYLAGLYSKCLRF